MSLSMRGITKAFDANVVLRDVDFGVADGEIHALIGENGAGKTTLMNILGGVVRADAGEIVIDGQSACFETPRESLDAGIAFIHQELNLINDLTVYENLFIGREKRHGMFLDRAAMIEASREVLARMDIPLDPCQMVRELDASYKQVVEIARALLMNAKIIIMDEPTTSLTESEIEQVFRMMRTVSGQGVSIVFISHKLGEVITICDAFTVLRDGQVVANGRTEDVTELDLARHMVGHEVRTERLRQQATLGEEVLRAEGLSRERKFHDVSFSLRAGEVLGFTGLLGDGRSELFQTVFGVYPQYEGEISVGGKPMKMNSTSAAFRAGLGYVPRNRKENGILGDLSVLENGTIVTLKQLTDLLFINRTKQRAQMDQNIRELSIKVGSVNDPITSLSGGNQQKVVLAKWLGAEPAVLIFDNPTQGVDVGAKEEIYDIILRLADSGVGIVVLSSEAQEIIRVCDRALVMFHGGIQGELVGDEMNEHNIMVLATGGAIQ